jgi:biopolymer transport protein ExbD
MRDYHSGGPLRVEEPRASINVTPLVDVCLVLLIIFMLVGPLMREGPDVALPAGAKAAPIPERGGQVVISIRADRSVWLGDTPIEPTKVAAALRPVADHAAERMVLVRGDRSLPYVVVRDVFKQLIEAGVSRAELVTLRDAAQGGS